MKKTLIVYASKTGVTRDVALYIQEHIEGSVLFDAAKEQEVDLSLYDQVIIGTPIYISQVLKGVKSFVDTYKAQLLTKELYLYTCGADENHEPRFFLDPIYGEELCTHAKSIIYAGTELRYKKMKFFPRLIMKMIAKKDHLDPDILFEHVDVLIHEALKA